MAEDTPNLKIEANCWRISVKILDLENEESDYSEMSDPNDPQYEPGRSDVDSDIDLDRDDNDQPRPIDLKISVNLKNTPFLKIRKKKKYS